MSEFISKGEQAHNPWQLGDDLFAAAQRIKRFIAHRDLASRGTVIRINQTMITPLVAEHKDKDIFVKSPNALIPLEQGYGVALMEGYVKLIGFGYSKYPMSGFSGEEEYGLVAFVAQDTLNGQSAGDLPHRLGLLPPELQSDISGIVTVVPITQDVRIAEIQNGVDIPDFVQDIDAKIIPYEYNYQEFVASINAITGQMAVGNEVIDGPRIESAFKMLTAMNLQCPFLGRTVRITDGYLRFPNPKKSNYLLAHGTIEGVLRKFVIDVYQEPTSGDWKSDVQAVMYHPDIARQVYAGTLAPTVADKVGSTCFIPLGLPHQLTIS